LDHIILLDPIMGGLHADPGEKRGPRKDVERPPSEKGSEVLDLNTPIREDRIIRLKTVLARTGLSRSTIYRKIAEGTFPPQIRISVNGAGWKESDINRWVADLVGWSPRRESDAE
jgi:prophage regulatory protein